MKHIYKIILFSLTIGITCLGKIEAQNLPLELCVEWQGGDRYDVKVKNFSNIISVQFSINYNPDFGQFLALDQFADLPGLDNFNFGTTPDLEEGIITFAWFSPTIQPQDLDDGDVLFSLLIENTNAALALPFISSDPIGTEVSYGDESVSETILISDDCPASNKGLITGRMQMDGNLDCKIDADDAPYGNQVIQFTKGDQTFIANTNREGQYWSWLEPGEYSMSIVDRSTAFDFCIEQSVVNVEDIFSTDTINILAQAIDDCHELSVALNTGRIRACFPTRFSLSYQNLGSATAISSYIDVEIDEDFEPISESSHSFVQLEDHLYRFDLGNINALDFGIISFTASLSCDAQFGATHCSTAKIYPSSECREIPPTWSGASVSLEASCQDDQLVFELSNSTDHDMTESVKAIVLRDDQRYAENDILLNAGDSETITISADGATYRVIVDQVANHPGEDHPTEAIELCGNGVEHSLGFVTQFATNDDNPEVDIHCQENVGSYDPNDKLSYPRGFQDDFKIAPQTSLNYTIRYQNTGTDTAYRVVIIDTLQADLDPNTISHIVSSHDVKMELYGERILRFVFDEINLPDSNVNLAASEGFVSFEIDHRDFEEKVLPIRNDAAIYFDYNPPIYTNEVLNTVVIDFLEVLVSTNEASRVQKLHVYPNPASPDDLLQLDLASAAVEGQLIDLQGKQIWQGHILDGALDLSSTTIEQGLYLLVLTQKDKKYTAKLIID